MKKILSQLSKYITTPIVAIAVVTVFTLGYFFYGANIAEAEYETISYIANSTDTGNALTVPASAQADDHLIVVGIADNGGGAHFQTPSGWTVVNTATSGSRDTRVWHKIATGSDASTSYDFLSFSGGAFVMIVLRGTDGTIVGSSPSTSSINTTDAGVTTTLENSWLILASAMQFGSGISGYAVVNNSPSWTERQEYTGTNSTHAAIATADYTTFTQDTGVGSVSYSGNTFGEGGVVLLAVQPAEVSAGASGGTKMIMGMSF